MGAIGSVTLTDSYKATYVAQTGDLTLAATATDFGTIYGSSTKTVKVLKVFLQLRDSTAAYYANDVRIIRRSTAPTGGTSAVIFGTPLDSSNASATATVRSYSVNPTSVGTFAGDVLWLQMTSFAMNNPQTMPAYGLMPIFDADKFGQAITLRGTADGLALNLNGATQAGNTPRARFAIVFSEE